MEPIAVEDVETEALTGATRWAELLRADALSVGRYVVEAGGPDEQDPHTEDEIYYVLSGRGDVRIGDERHPVEPGDVVYVDRGVDHAFVDVEERLDLLVVFAPPEGSLADD
ncbi:MAG: cupin domain-containing protein [Halobacteriales archaeon]|nr:cupin domain-containing protein [Halobacteriales archaeon]